MGRAHGEEMRSTIGEGLGRWLDRIEAGTGLGGDAYVASFLAATDFMPAIEKFAPALLKEVRGIAEGAQQRFETMLAYQLMDEEWWYRTGVMHARKAVEACSAVGVVRDGGTSIVAQNMDLPSYYDGTQVVLHLRPAGAPEALVFAPAGMIGATGLNRDGVAVCCNELPQLSHRPSGLPVACVMRGVLAQSTLGTAADWIRSVPHATGQNYLLGAPGVISNLEASPKQVCELEATSALLMHTNHPLVNDDVDDKVAVQYESRSTTRARLDRLHANLDGLDGSVTVEDIQRTLSDREVPVCVPRGSRGMTLGSLVMELSADPVLHIAPGPPADTPYTTLRFS